MKLFKLLILGLLLGSGCSQDVDRGAGDYPRAETEYRTTIVASRPLGKLTVSDKNGGTADIECSVCHSANSDAVGESMHQDLVFDHGPSTCNACHSEDRSTLHLADGQPIEFEDTIQLCAQCHGPQYRDYKHGSHGGMSGYWDKKRGPRTRNHCVNCHDPHAPGYPKVQPAPAPRDRFLTPPEEH